MNKVKVLKQTCYMCPSQWEGQFEDGTYFYVRYRWGWLSISISEVSVQKAVVGKSLMEISYGDSLDGLLSFDELKDLTKEIIEWSDVKEEETNEQ